MEIKLNKNFKKRAAGMFGKYSFQVGILDDGPHKEAKFSKPGTPDNLSTYAGGPIRKKSSKDSGLTLSDVSKSMRERLGFNYLVEPFKLRSSDIIKFSNTFFKMVFGKSEPKRAENLLQAIVRNPILRGDYGSNSSKTKRIKGFDRLGIDTAQWFKAIKAKVTLGGRG